MPPLLPHPPIPPFVPVIEASLNRKRTEESSSDEHSAEESDEEAIQELTEEEIPTLLEDIA